MEVIKSEYVDAIVEIAKEVETEDPIDWGVLNISEDDAYRLIALNVVETLSHKYDDPMAKEVFLATITKLIVENFVLNLKLRNQAYGSETVHMR